MRTHPPAVATSVGWECTNLDFFHISSSHAYVRVVLSFAKRLFERIATDQVLRWRATGTVRASTSCRAEVVGSHVTCNNKPSTEHTVPSRVELVGYSGSAHACDAKTHAFKKVDVMTSLRR